MTVQTEVRNDPRAHALLRDAHDAGYHLPVDFAGFRARLTGWVAGEAIDGAVTVHGPRAIEFEVGEAAADPWVQRELASMVGHRWHLPYEQADGKHTLSLDPNAADPLGQRIGIHDDSYESSYRVSGGQIVQVNRTMGPRRFSILIQERVTVDDGRHLPNHFTVTFWDTSSERLVRSDVYEDRYSAVGQVWLPSRRRVISATDEGFSVQHFELSDHELLTGGEAQGHVHTLSESGMAARHTDAATETTNGS